MKKLGAVALTVALLGGVGVAAAPTADAAAPGRHVPKSWMTRKEFRWIYVDSSGWGDRYKRVRKHTGSRGRLSYESSWYEDVYCDQWSYDYTYCDVYKGGITHTTQTYTWRTGRYSRDGAQVTFEDGRATSKSFYRLD